MRWSTDPACGAGLRAVTVAMAFAAAGCAAAAPSPGLAAARTGLETRVEFTGTVTSVGPLADEWVEGADGRRRTKRLFPPRGLPMVVVDGILSEFAVAVRVDAVEEGAGPDFGEIGRGVEAGAEIALAVHSPVRLFHVPGEEAVGRRWCFELRRYEVASRGGGTRERRQLSAKALAGQVD